MIFAFKKLSGKVQTVLSILHIFHVETKIDVRLEPCINTLYIISH